MPLVVFVLIAVVTVGLLLVVRRLPDEPPSPRRANERIADRAHGLRSMGRIVEIIGWFTLAMGVIIGIAVGAARDDAIYAVNQQVVRHPVYGVLAFLSFAFAALILLIVGRVVALLAEHVAVGVGADLDGVALPE